MVDRRRSKFLFRYGTVRYGKGAKVMNDGEGDGLRGEGEIMGTWERRGKGHTCLTEPGGR